jgi:hypothetical protein
MQMDEQNHDAPRQARLIQGIGDNEVKMRAGCNGPRPKELEMKQITSTPAPPKKDEVR